MYLTMHGSASKGRGVVRSYHQNSLVKGFDLGCFNEFEDFVSEFSICGVDNACPCCFGVDVAGQELCLPVFSLHTTMACGELLLPLLFGDGCLADLKALKALVPALLWLGVGQLSRVPKIVLEGADCLSEYSECLEFVRFHVLHVSEGVFEQVGFPKAGMDGGHKLGGCTNPLEAREGAIRVEALGYVVRSISDALEDVFIISMEVSFHEGNFDKERGGLRG